MRRGDLIAVGGYLLAAVGAIALAERLRERGVPARYTRKLVHVAAGLSPLYVIRFADTKSVGVLPYAATVVTNAIFWRRGTFQAMSSQEGTPGIVYFPLVQALMLAWLWEPRSASSRLHVALAALLTLALGDAAAALVGQQWGRHRYGQKSWEGSAAMLAVTACVVGPTLRVAGVPRWREAALLAGVTATGVEALSPHGLDNLTVPASVALVLLAVL
jgi:dolichol kinase